MHEQDNLEKLTEGGLTKEEEDELTPLLTQLVREATKSRGDRVKVEVRYRESNPLPFLLNDPPTLADFNKQIRSRFGRPLSITAYNAKKNSQLEIDSDELLNMVIRKFASKRKVPQFTLIDKHIREPNSDNRINHIDHAHCLPGPSRATTVFLPRIVRSLGEGTFAKVQLIRCSKTGALYAMKKLSNIEGRQATREMEAFTTIKSKRVVPLVTAFNEGEYVKFVMEYMPGGSLHSLITEGNKAHESPPLSWHLIHKYSRELLEGVEDIHRAGYVHMDIKPLNLVIDIVGSLKITDFGSFSKMGSEDYSCELTPMYASPEALAKNSPWEGTCDIWSVGVTILEMVVGRVPWSNVSAIEMPLRVYSMVDDTIREELSGLSPPSPLREVLAKTLVVDPMQRSNASELLSLFNTENGSSILARDTR